VRGVLNVGLCVDTGGGEIGMYSDVVECVLSQSVLHDEAYSLNSGRYEPRVGAYIRHI
jgi:hypothetical protein